MCKKLLSKEFLGHMAILLSSRGTSELVGNIIKFQRSELSPLSHAGYRNYYIALLTLELYCVTSLNIAPIKPKPNNISIKI